MMITAFLITFFNTAILNLMLTANFQESNYTFLRFLLYAGNRTDWDTKWYNEIGPLLIQTMLIQSIMPIVMFLVSYLTQKIFELLDRGFTCNRYKTKKKTIYAHTEFYAGPEYLIQY